MDEQAPDASPKPLTEQETLRRIAEMAGISESLRTCLEVAHGYTNLMLRKMDAVDPLRRFAEPVVNATREASDLACQLLGIVRSFPNPDWSNDPPEHGHGG